MTRLSVPRPRMSGRTLALLALVAALLLAGVASLWASQDPDGLSRVAHDLGLAPQLSTGSGGLLAGYRAGFLADEGWSRAMAGVVGVLVVLALATGLTLLLRRRGR